MFEEAQLNFPHTRILFRAECYMCNWINETDNYEEAALFAEEHSYIHDDKVE